MCTLRQSWVIARPFSDKLFNQCLLNRCHLITYKTGVYASQVHREDSRTRIVLSGDRTWPHPPQPRKPCGVIKLSHKMASSQGDFRFSLTTCDLEGKSPCERVKNILARFLWQSAGTEASITACLREERWQLTYLSVILFMRGTQLYT